MSAQEAHHAEIMEGLRAQEEHVEVWQRHPLVGIPLIANPPSIDGTVEVREWLPSARIGRLMDYNKGVGVKDNTDIFLAYTNTHLYIAFQFERPGNSLLPSEKDWMEVLFDTSHQHKKYYNAGFALNKILWDGIGPNVDKAAWAPKWDYQSRATDFGWEGEIAIPFNEFGLDTAPEAGTIWGADFLRNEKTPVDRLAIWSYRGKNWHAAKNLGHILFTGKPVAIRAEAMGWIPDQQQAGVEVLISNFGDQPMTLDATMELRKAAGTIRMEYFPRIDSAMTEELGAAIGSPLRNEVDTALGEYPVLKQQSEKVTILPDSSKLIQLVQPDEPGKYLAGFAIKEGETLLAGSLLPVEITVPLSIKTNSYLYSAKTVEYEVDLRRVAHKITEDATLQLLVKNPQGKVLAQDNKPLAKDVTEIGGYVQFEPSPDTALTVHANILTSDRVLAQNMEHLRVPPKPEWLHNSLGKKKFVPYPFTPLQATEREVKTLTSTYNWAQNELLPNFKVNNNEVLAAPTALTFKDKNGKNLPLKINSFKLQSSDIEQVVYEFNGELAGKATVSGTVTIEFDGLSWYRLKIEPQGPLELSAAALEFTLKKGYSRFCTAYGPEGGSLYAGRVPAEGIHAAFSHSFWLGNMDGGVQWFAENPQNWSNANPKDVVQITADKKVGRIKINFIDKPVTLEKSIEWSFGFTPTPSRVKPKEWGDFAFMQTNFYSEDLRQPITAEAAADWSQRKRWEYYNGPTWQLQKKNIYAYIHHSYWPELFGYPGTYVPATQQKLRTSIDALHQEGIKTILYAGWGVNDSAPEWENYGMEMVRLPLYNSGYGTFRQEPASLFTDWFVWKVAEMIKDHDIDGLFIDSVTSPILSENYMPGMRWVDERGKVRGSFPILATREWLKRLYKLFHGELKRGGVIYNHNSPPPIMAIETFSDVRCPSEFAQSHHGEFDGEFVDYFIAKNSGEPFGLFSELTNKDWMGASAVKKTPQIYALALPLNISLKALDSVYVQSYNQPGSYNVELPGGGINQLMPLIFEANRWIDKSTAEYLPWWKNADYISTSPDDDQVLNAIWLQRGKKALVCVSNLDNEPRRIDVSLQLTQLGMKSIIVEDAITGEVISVQNGKMSLDVEFQRFRLVKIAAK